MAMLSFYFFIFNLLGIACARKLLGAQTDVYPRVTIKVNRNNFFLFFSTRAMSSLVWINFNNLVSTVLFLVNFYGYARGRRWSKLKNCKNFCAGFKWNVLRAGPSEMANGKVKLRLFEFFIIWMCCAQLVGHCAGICEEHNEKNWKWNDKS